MKNQRLRRIIAAALTALVWAALAFHAILQRAWTLSDSGAWIPLYPPPLEIIFLTLCAVVASVLLYRWHRYDRIERLVPTLDAEERERLLDALLEQRGRDEEGARSEKRKRLAADGEIAAEPGESLDALERSRRQARAG